MMIGIGIALAVLLVVAFLVPDRKVATEQVEAASDYPVPPLDRAVPTRPKHKLRAGIRDDGGG